RNWSRSSGSSRAAASADHRGVRQLPGDGGHQKPDERAAAQPAAERAQQNSGPRIFRGRELRWETYAHTPPSWERTIALRPPLRTIAPLVGAAARVAGCASSADWPPPHAKPAPIGPLGPGFVAPATPPAPEGTVKPRPGSWTGIHPSKDYRVVLLTE